MKIGFLFPSLFASTRLFPDRIFAPADLARDLVRGLVGLGHEVVVFAPEGFITDGGQHVIIPAPYWEKDVPYDKLRHEPEDARRVRTDEVRKRQFELEATTTAFAYARDHTLDIIHSYHDFLFIPHYLADLTGVPTVFTLHDPLPPEGSFEYGELTKFREHKYLSISDSFRKHPSLKLNFTATIHHGVNIHAFPFDDNPTDYVLSMGRLVPEKGLHDAILACSNTNIRLEIGTQLPDGDKETPYFREKIKPHLGNPLVGKPGIVKGADKIVLYKEAIALLMPIHWEEPFGMVMIEAMACGTPVIAYNRGSVPEVVVDGVTGFIIDPPEGDETPYPVGEHIIKAQGIDGLTEAMERIGEIRRVDCRAHVEAHFSSDIMASKHADAYKRVTG